MDKPKAFIERLRRQKFSVGTKAVNPLAPELHKAIQQLSVELYQNDFHFIKEIIQNAEDNAYDEDVCPTLEFRLIKEDIAKVGASATLLVFNNERGLTTADVTALCSVACSTKEGRRDEGYIGCKGIGFKSVFMICETPMIISNGYRLRFRETASKEAAVGYIVPEWIESPSDNTIMSACGINELSTTVLILPIRDGKVDLVRKQLKELSPEMILFLTSIRDLNVVIETEDPGDSIMLMITRSKPISGITSDACKFFEVTLGVQNSAATAPDKYPYLIFEKSYPVTHPDEGRREILEWTVTLAFPKSGRASSGHIGDVFSFLPTELRTGFPFIINADFILTSSRETIRFDSAWNLGILDCIPAAYEISFKIMIRVGKPFRPLEITHTSTTLLQPKDAYRFLPHNNVQNANKYYSTGALENRQLRQKLCVEDQQFVNLHQLERVRAEIFQRLQNDPLIILSKDISGFTRHGECFLPARDCWQMKLGFHEILKSAAKNNHPAPSVMIELLADRPTATFTVVDEHIQKHYADGLAALGVPEMSLDQYETFLMDSQWLLNLPEQIYLQVLTFFAFEVKLFEGNAAESSYGKDTFRLLKVRRGPLGTVELATFSEMSEGTVKLFYTSSTKDAKWISAWTNELSHLSVMIMPAETSKALKEAGNSKELMNWIKKQCSLEQLTVKKYSQILIERFIVANGNYNPNGTFSLPVMQFLYSAIHENLISWDATVKRLRSLGHVTIMSSRKRRASLEMRNQGRVLLPPKVSKWSLLFSLSSDYAQRFVALSDKYLEPVCLLVESIVTCSPGPNSMLEFIKQSFDAIDIPYVKVPTNKRFPFLHPMTMEKSLLMLEWLKEFLPKRRTTKMENENDFLLTDLKELSWVKTVHHGWQCPTSVFFSPSYFENHFTPHDLPFLDVPAYSSLDVTDSDVQSVLAELGVVTNIEKGGAAVAEYFSKLPAEKLDQEMANRFYAYLHAIGWRDESPNVKIWIPTSCTSKVPIWRAPAECIIRDTFDIFKNSSHVTVLRKLYDKSLLPFFEDVLHVPERASADLYCDIWLKWSRTARSSMNEVEDGNGCLSKPLALCVYKVKHVLWNILQKNWQESAEEDSVLFHSRAWVPVAPRANDSFGTISIVPPSQVFIEDESALCKSLSRAANGQLAFAWVFPDLVGEKSDCLVRFYSKIGVKKLSELVQCDVNIPPNVWKKQIPRGKGLICEGLLRSVLAYLCHTGKKHDLSITDREKILSPLISATEVVLSDPFEKHFRLNIETLTSSPTVTKRAFAFYNQVKGKLYYIKRDHALLQGDVPKRDFNEQLATTVSHGILPEYPELAQGLTMLLKLLCDSGFAMKSVEYELHTQNLSIFPEDEKLLIGNMAMKAPN